MADMTPNEERWRERGRRDILREIAKWPAVEFDEDCVELPDGNVLDGYHCRWCRATAVEKAQIAHAPDCMWNRSQQPECWCGEDAAIARGETTYFRYDIVCPKHDR